MQNQNLLRGISALLVLSILTVSFAGCQKKVKTDNPILNQELNGEAYQQTEYAVMAEAEHVKKEESVYANAKADGEVYHIYVTDWLHTRAPQVRVEDRSDLKDITNIHTLTQPVQKGKTMLWDMDTTDLYYSGTSKKELPISFDIEYFLNDKKVSAEEIAGKAGDIAIRITVQNAQQETIEVNNKKYKVTSPMLVVGGTILPEDVFTNISIDHGTALSDGAKQVVFFAGIPGMDESLGLSDLKLTGIDEAMYTNTYTITGETECFSLSNMMFAVLPFSSIGSIGIGGLTDGIDTLKVLLTDVEKVQAAMNGLQVEKIIDLLYGDTSKVKKVMDAVGEASKLYTENEAMLKTFSAYMTEENMQKIDKLLVDLEKTDLDAVSKTLSDPKLKMALLLLPKLSKSLGDMAELAKDLDAAMPIFQSLAKDMENPEVAKSLQDLPKTLERLNQILKTLEDNKTLLEAAGALVAPENQKYVDTLTDTAEKYVGLSTLSKEQISSLSDKAIAWVRAGSKYDIYSSKMENVKSTVTFAYKTDAIAVPKAEDKTQGENSSEKDNAFVAYFKRIFKKK